MGARSGKHASIKRNLMALTGMRTFSAAAAKCQVLGRVDLRGSVAAEACALCGTRFKSGARVRLGKSRVLVGGECCVHLLSGTLGGGRPLAPAKRTFREFLAARYQDVTEPGAWLTWLKENAPPQLQPALVYVEHLGTARSDEDMTALVRFHDQNRRFAREALFPEHVAFRELVDIPEVLTFSEYDRILAKLLHCSGARETRARLDGFARREILSFLARSDAESRRAWQRLTTSERRSVTALAALTLHRSAPDAALCSSSIAQGWRQLRLPLLESKFVWNPLEGLGIVDASADEPQSKSTIWLWKTGKYSPRAFSLSYWLSVTPRNGAALERLERAACSALKRAAG